MRTVGSVLHRFLVLVGVFLLFGVLPAAAQEGEAEYLVALPEMSLSGLETDITIEPLDAAPADPGDLTLVVGGEQVEVAFEDGVGTATLSPPSGSPEISLQRGGQSVPFTTESGGEAVTTAEMSTIPAWLSILPPLIAIGLALVTRRVIPSLFAGIWLGAWFVLGLSPVNLWNGLLDAIDRWVVEAIVPQDGSSGHMAIVIFTLLIGGMIGIISRNGGAKAVVDRITGWAKSPVKGQVASTAVGSAIFFDDYGSMLITGNSMRPVTDRLDVSRSKLSFIVDSTAAPVATVALITTWIGFQVGLISDGLAQIEGFDEGAYGVFLRAIPFMFYSAFIVLFVWMIASTGRDFGPMARAERRARKEGAVAGGDQSSEDSEFAPKEGIPLRMTNALIPILVLVGGTIAALFATGTGDSVQDIIGSADSFSALMWASLWAVLVAGALSIGQRILTLGETVDAWFVGLKSVVEVLIILTLAWALSNVTVALNTAGFLASLLGETLPVWTVPGLLFVVAAATAFATGTSWGTMGILIPLTIPLTWSILQANELASPEGHAVLFAAIAAVLSGAVWGDHTSPISDTTVLSAGSSGDGLMDHVNTQLPYAAIVGAIALLAFLAVGFGVPWWISMLVGAALAVAVVYVFGRHTDEEEAKEPERKPEMAHAGS